MSGPAEEPAKTRPRRRRDAPTSRSHEEIYGLCETALRRSKEATRVGDLMTQTMQRVETKVDELKRTVGHAGRDEHGHVVGTGMAGHLARLDKQVDDKFTRYDRWISRAIGFGIALVPLGGLIWWLLSERLAHLLRP